MAVTKGRYQTVPGTLAIEWHVKDTLTQHYIALCDSEKDATLVANALNFNYRPRDYGYKLVD